MIKKIDKCLSAFTYALGILSGVGVIVIMLLTVADVIMRRVLLTSIIGSYEIVERLLLISVFGTFALAQTSRSHVHVTLLVSRLPKALGMAVFGVLGLLSTFAAGFCGYALIQQGIESFNLKTTTAVLQWPLYPFFYIAAFFTFVLAITILWDSVKSFIGIFNEEVREDIRSSW